jgi:glycine cleavage system aminomethyltransferase T
MLLSLLENKALSILALTMGKQDTIKQICCFHPSADEGRILGDFIAYRIDAMWNTGMKVFQRSK